MLEPLYTAEEMGAAEEGHDVVALMERAGKAVARVALEDFPGARSITVVCGPGNNGGDGRVAATALREAGKEVLVVESKPEDEPKILGSPDLVVDALFGTGFSGEPRPAAAGLIDAMNALDLPVLAVDVPSGVDASTGEVAGVVVHADATVTFHGEKVGLQVAPGRFHAGYVECVEIGLAHRDTQHRLVTSEILRLVPRKTAEDTKYTAGSVLVVGGSPGMTGAVCLTALAAFRADAGYVAVAAPAESLPVIETRVLEAVKLPLEHVWDAVERAGALAIGPGLGRSPDRRALVRRLLEETTLPAVVDADALHELEPFSRDGATVLTPHAGELGRLLGRDSDWVGAHRLAAAREAVERFGCVVLLKGADTIVAEPGGGVLVRPNHTAGLATAGTGDVLTGIVAAFLAKGLEPTLAAAAAATAHGMAAFLGGEGRPGLVASDVVDALPRALASV
jgi:NAD(P)H-hydrate epimerase